MHHVNISDENSIDGYGDTMSIITTFRGTSGMVRMYVHREESRLQVANAGGGGYDKRGTCLAELLIEAFQPELRRIAARAHMRYRTTANGLERFGDDDGQRAPQGLYGMTAYYAGRKVDRVRLDGGCGWESMVRIAEAIGLQVRYIAETKNTYVHEVSGIDKLRTRRQRDAERAAAKAATA